MTRPAVINAVVMAVAVWCIHPDGVPKEKQRAVDG